MRDIPMHYFLDVIARDGRSYLFDPCSSIYVVP